MSDPTSETMRAVRLRAAGGPEALALEEIETPRPGPDEALIRVHAAAITRDELEWPVDRLPAIPSYELSGTVARVGPGVESVAVGQEVFSLTSFDRDGVAADLAVVPAALLAPKPRTLDHVESAAIPMGALSAWQALFVHGGLRQGQRVLVTGAAGGVGHLAVQLAHHRGAHVIGIASPSGIDIVKRSGADEIHDRTAALTGELEQVDLVFDTAGGDLLARAPELVREGGRIVTVAEEPPEGVDAVYFVVEPDGDQLAEIGRLADAGDVRPEIDSVFPLTEARQAFERSMAAGKRGKVVLRVDGDA
jgi:NADPH:quinone reductase-like Zn-dependent oxidoreductase